MQSVVPLIGKPRVSKLMRACEARFSVEKGEGCVGNCRARRGQATTSVFKMERSQKKGRRSIFTNQNQGMFLTRRGGMESISTLDKTAKNGKLRGF